LKLLSHCLSKSRNFEKRENLYHEKEEHVTAGFFPCTAADSRILCSGILVGTTTTSTTTYKQD
jgi:hypothetical protein